MKTNPHIILIQDDPYLVETRKALLQKQGYSVDVVQSVREARRECAKFQCDLVIVDADKDHDTALELCEEIKMNNPRLKVALMTGYFVHLTSECPDAVVSREDGPAGFMSKVKTLLARSVLEL